MSRAGKSGPPGLPRWAALVFSLQAGPAHREAYLGDMEELYRRRTARTGTAETGWLYLQILTGCLPWARAHLASSGERWRSLAWAIVALASAAATLTACLAAFNHPHVLQFVRDLPAPVRLPLAVGLNLVSAASAGAVLGWLRTGPGTVAGGILGICTWAGARALSGLPDAGALLWMGLLGACTVLGWAALRRPPSVSARVPSAGA